MHSITVTLCVLIRHMINVNLVEIQQFRHEWSKIIYENTQWNQKAFHNLQLYLACRYIPICVLITHTFCESFVKIFMLPNADAVHFCNIFSDIGQCCQPAQIRKQSSKSKILVYDDLFRKLQKYCLHKLTIKENQNTTFYVFHLKEIWIFKKLQTLLEIWP